MAKLTHSDLTQLSSNETSAVNTINANGALTEAALENTLSRDGTSPNTMGASLDMNSNKILNVAAGTASSDGVNLSQLTSATGQVPGLSMTMETTQTDSDQGAGKVWFNAAVASATILYMDDADTNGANISTFVQTWDNSTNSSSRGYIHVIQKASAVNYAIYEIDGAVTDATGYTKIPVNYMIGAGTLADGDPVTVNFIRTGDQPAIPSLKMTWDTATADADQGAGTVFLNNGTVSSATVLYIDDVDAAAGTSINSQVDSWDDSTNTIKGTITVTKTANAAVFATFNVTGSVTSASTYSKIAVTHVTSVGSFSDGDEVFVQFVRSGDKGDTGSQGVQGDTGNTGATGPDGFGGLPYTFSTTTTDSDPGAGNIRLNNGTLGSVTAAYIDDTSAATSNPDVSAFLLTWDDSTSTSDRGQVTIVKKSAQQNFAIYKISGASTDASGYVKLALTHVDSSGSFSNSDDVLVHFARTGNAGSGSGDLLASNNLSDVSSASTSLSNLGGVGVGLTLALGG
tara:strand:+ start:3705 stop:5246 length:1542 start_codon:yes stop_codon:yes gene_type:complete